MKLTKKRQNKFLAALAATANASVACRRAGVGRNTVYTLRAADKAFSAAWDDALEQAADKLEREAWRRATGYREPVWHKGQQVGVVKRYSDPLLTLLLRAARPERYRERAEVKHEARQTIVVIRGDASGLPPLEIDDGR